MAKDKKAKFPKEVGGVKVPKKLRKSASVVAELAQNPLAREVLSAVLMAGAAALTKRKSKGPAAQAAPHQQGSEIGNLIAQGVAAFVGNLGKPAEKKPADEARPTVATAKPRPKSKPVP